ncbi:hypothetical protein F4810DRAFT_461493 [Camillea tinctor]|nr:hypothetical protein F4810DRAFT_461493 [Camillea tinctor]
MSSDPDWIPSVYITNDQSSYYQESAVSSVPGYTADTFHDDVGNSQYKNEQTAATLFDEILLATTQAQTQNINPFVPPSTMDASYSNNNAYLLPDMPYSSPTNFIIPVPTPVPQCHSLNQPQLQNQIQTDRDQEPTLKLEDEDWKFEDETWNFEDEDDDPEEERWVFHRNDPTLKVTEPQPRPKRARSESEPVYIWVAEDPGRTTTGECHHRKKRLRLSGGSDEGEGKGKEIDRGELDEREASVDQGTEEEGEEEYEEEYYSPTGGCNSSPLSSPLSSSAPSAKDNNDDPGGEMNVVYENIMWV